MVAIYGGHPYRQKRASLQLDRLLVFSLMLLKCSEFFLISGGGSAMLELP